MCLAGRGDDDVPVLDRPVITLQINRTGCALVAVDRSASDPGDFLVANDLFAVSDHGHHSPDERDVVSLPLAGGTRRVFTRLHKPIDTAKTMGVRFLAVVVFDLHLVAT